MTTHYIGGNHITREQVEKNLDSVLPTLSPTDICFTWNTQVKALNVFDINEMNDQVKLWISANLKTEHKKLFQMKDYNNKTKTIRGREYYACVLQKFTGRTELDEDGVEQDEMDEDDNPTDAFALMCGEEWVSGYTYYFTIKNMRDWCALTINTKSMETMTMKNIVELSHPMCCLCNSRCENKWGHNALPLASGICCGKCNFKRVIPARVELMREETDEERNQRLQIVAELEATAVPIIVCDATIEIVKVKKVQEKSRTKDANKAQNDKKRQREEYERQVVEAEALKKRKDAEKKQYQQQQKAKAKK